MLVESRSPIYDYNCFCFYGKKYIYYSNKCVPVAKCGSKTSVGIDTSQHCDHPDYDMMDRSSLHRLLLYDCFIMPHYSTLDHKMGIPTGSYYATGTSSHHRKIIPSTTLLFPNHPNIHTLHSLLLAAFHLRGCCFFYESHCISFPNSFRGACTTLSWSPCICCPVVQV